MWNIVPAGVNIASEKELIGNIMTVDQIREHIGATTLDYLSLENMKKSLQNKDVNLDCFKDDDK